MSDERILTTRRQRCLGLMAMLAVGCSTGESRPSLTSALNRATAPMLSS